MTGQRAKRFRVLVVDDDEATRRTVEGVLGADVDVVTSAKPFDPERLIATVLQLARICDLKRTSRHSRTGSMPGSR